MLKSLAGGLLSIFMISCNQMYTSFPDVDYVPFKTSENDNWGLISVDGKPLFEDEFDHEPSISVNGVFFVENDKGEISYFLSDKKPKQINNDTYISGGFYTEGVIPVVKEEHPVSFINKDGKEILSLGEADGKRISAVNAYFSDGLMLFVTEEGKYGYINPKGQIVVKPIYDEAYPFSESVALVKMQDKYILIDTSGKEVAHFKQDLEAGYLPLFFDGLLSNGNKVFDKKGNLAFRSPSRWNRVYPFYNGCAIFEEEGSYGLIDKQGETVIRAKYDKGIKKIGNSYVGINEEKGAKMSVVFFDEEENKLGELEDIEDFSMFTQDRFIVKDQGEYYFIDSEGKAIDKNNYKIIAIPNSRSYYNTNQLFLSFLYRFLNWSENCCMWISSDFYPAQEAVSSVLGVLNTNGVGNIRLGMPLRDLRRFYNMGESDSHSYDFWNNFEGQSGKGNLKTSYQVQFSDYISEYYGYNDDATVKHIIINIDRNSVWCSNSEGRLYNATLDFLKSIGFTKSGHNDDWLDEAWDIYSSNKYNYFIAVNKDGSKLCLEEK